MASSQEDLTQRAQRKWRGRIRPDNRSGRINRSDAGETKKVTLPLTQIPAAGASATLKVSVKKVPGEQNLDNNSQTFDVKF